MARIASAAGLFGMAILRLASSAALLPAAAPPPASAQTLQPESEIVVTARRRAEDPQRVPIPISVVDGKTIEANDIRNTTDLTARSPNLLAPANPVVASTPTFYIRGVGEGTHNWNDENGVAFFIDDVYVQSRSAAWIDFSDMDRVEVLRGPQGTLYGRNSVSGAIKFFPRRADPTRVSAYAEITFGQTGRLEVKTGANAPIDGGRGAVRLSLFDIRDDGDLTEVDTANRPINRNLGRMHHTGARLSTLWRPHEGLEFELNGDIVHQDDGMYVVTPIVPADPAGIDDPHQYLSRTGRVRFVPLYGPRRSALDPLTVGGGSGLTGGGVVFKVRAQTGFGRLSSITAWRDYRGYFVSQLGGRATPSTIFGVTLYGSVNTVFETSAQWTQELQLTGKWRAFDYTAGIFFFHNRWRESEYGASSGVPANLSPFVMPGQTQSFGGSFNDADQTTNSYAIYGSVDWHVAPTLTVSAGARETLDHKGLLYASLFEDHVHDYPGFPVNTSKRWARFTPRLGVDWKPSGTLLVYASWAKGYKVGAVEGPRSTEPSTVAHWFGPELATTWEAGIKADALGHRLHANLDAFTSLNNGRLDPINPILATTSAVRTRGIEAEASFQPVSNFRLHGSAGLLWAKYLKLPPDHPLIEPDFNGFAPGYAGQPPMSPKYTLSADASYRLQLGSHGMIDMDASVIAVARHYHMLGLNNYDSEIVDPYAVVDASLHWTRPDRRLQVTVGAHNLLDKTYWTAGMFGIIPEFAGRYYADPRRWYVTLRYDI